MKDNLKTHIAPRYKNKTFCGLEQNTDIVWSDAIKFSSTRYPKSERITNWCGNCKKISELRKIKQLNGEELKRV